MQLEIIDKLREKDSNVLFRQGTIAFITVALTAGDAASLSLLALYNPYLSENGTLGTLIIMIAICFVLNFIPLMMAKMKKDICAGLSDISRQQYRMLCGAAVMIMGLLFSVLVVVRMSSISLPEKEETVTGFEDFDEDFDGAEENAEPVEAEETVPLSAIALTLLLSLEPLGTSVANYLIMSAVYDAFEEHKSRARRALRKAESRLNELLAEEYLLAADSESAERDADLRQYRIFLERLEAQREECETESRQALAERIHADAEQLDRLLPSDTSPDGTEENAA